MYTLANQKVDQLPQAGQIDAQIAVHRCHGGDRDTARAMWIELPNAV
jgi:hypothetical protein